MNRTSRILSGAMVALLASVVVQPEETQGPPKPGPEHKKLGYFVGDWRTEGEMKPGFMGPGGRFASTDKCEWFEGGFAVVCRSEGKGPSGPTKSLGILSYSPEEKVYTYTGTDSMGVTMTTVPRGTVSGKTWTYNDQSLMNGEKVKSRVVIKELSPKEHTFTMELQGKDGKWMPMMESKSTKVN
jgi:hypothetical protein